MVVGNDGRTKNGHAIACPSDHANQEERDVAGGAID
jgi:hypothetical protein